LDSDSSITFAEFRDYAFSTRMEQADRVLDDLLPRAKAGSDDKARNAAAILERWDRAADSSSRGAVLFTEWWNEYTRRMRGRSPFLVPWNENAPRTTPDGLADTVAAVAALATASETVARQYGSADVKWGAVHRARRDGLDYAMSGAGGEWGVFRVAGFSDEGDGKRAVVGGTSWVAAIEFADPVRAVSLLGYGNASRAGSVHRTDQLALYARKQWKPVVRERSAIERNLILRERF
jgi:acyl-homoserine-lactone acylase